MLCSIIAWECSLVLHHEISETLAGMKEVRRAGGRSADWSCFCPMLHTAKRRVCWALSHWSWFRWLAAGCHPSHPCPVVQPFHEGPRFAGSVRPEVLAHHLAMDMEG